jgi:hypothetical protein
MEQPENAFDLSPEQQETASLLQRLLGKAISNRYVDFCRLSAGAFALSVSRLMAGHALRELDSLLRHVLEVPMEVQAEKNPARAYKIEEARQELRTLGFDNEAIERAAKALEPRINHKTQIRNLVARLGLAPNGDIANLWVSLNGSFGRVHERSFHRSLQVDGDFRAQYQRPFDTVIRAIALALQSRYAALMRRVEELAAMPDRAQAARLFANEIPGALPLQYHFYERLLTGDWLPYLAKQGLLGEPLSEPDDGSSGGMRFRQWPVGRYLLRMAQSPDRVTRDGVAAALRNVASSNHPDVQYDGLEILAALPPAESAPLADVGVRWLGPGARFLLLQGPETFVKRLAEGKQAEAALRIARALLQLWDQNGELGSHYGRSMYEYQLPSLVAPLTQCCGEASLRLFANLLLDAATISGKIDSAHFTSRPIGDDGMANHDVYEALLAATRRSAEILVKSNATNTSAVANVLAGYSPKIFVRLTLYVLALNPSEAPDLATAYLLNPELIEATWCRDEYARLALVWFPSLTSDDQAAVFRVIDGLPDKYLPVWQERFEEQRRSAPGTEDERKFRAAAFREVVWRWRAVLPAPRQETLNRIVAELGDPDAWKIQLFPPEESPLTRSDFSARPIPDIVAFLRTWKPGNEPARQTITALAQALRTAVSNNAPTYAANAEQFSGLTPVYVRHVLEGLEVVANNRANFSWGNVLKLIESAFARFHDSIDPSTVFDGDDRSWTWACIKAAELLAAGLRRGAEGIGFEHTNQVHMAILALMQLAPREPEIEDFEERYRREPFFAAQGTLRGLAIELCILLIFWLSKDTSTLLGTEPRKALAHSPDIENALDVVLADHSASGRVPRAIIGRYLSYLFYLGEDWLKHHMDALFPQADEALQHASWHGYLNHDYQPVADLVSQLRPCYAKEIVSLADLGNQPDREFRRERLADHLMVLYLWGALPDDLLESFWEHAPSGVRQHAMWYLGTQLALPDLPDEIRSRGFSYWERRLGVARRSDNPDAFRAELGAIGQWTLRDRIDDDWLADQLLALLQASFVPTDAFHVIDWLANIALRSVDRAVEILSALLRHPLVDQWIYTTQRDPIRAVLIEGLSHGTEETVARIQGLISYLSSIGETSYLDLLRTSAAE